MPAIETIMNPELHAQVAAAVKPMQAKESPLTPYLGDDPTDLGANAKDKAKNLEILAGAAAAHSAVDWFSDKSANLPIKPFEASIRDHLTEVAAIQGPEKDIKRQEMLKAAKGLLNTGEAGTASQSLHAIFDTADALENPKLDAGMKAQMAQTMERATDNYATIVYEETKSAYQNRQSPPEPQTAPQPQKPKTPMQR